MSFTTNPAADGFAVVMTPVLISTAMAACAATADADCVFEARLTEQSPGALGSVPVIPDNVSVVVVTAVTL
jgi:hypothetical protein